MFKTMNTIGNEKCKKFMKQKKKSWKYDIEEKSKLWEKKVNEK